MSISEQVASLIERRRREHDALRPATIAPGDDPRTQAVIRQAQEDLRREQAAGPLDEREILKTFNAKDLNDPVIAAVRFLNGPAVQGRVVPGGYFTADRIEHGMDRHALAFWRERFDLVAERLGYRKN